MKKIIFSHLIAATTVLLITAAFSTAGASSTQKEITRARGNCHSHKLQVKRLEAKTAEDDPALTEARRAWESSCAHAQQLMSARNGQTAPATVSAADPQEQ